MRKVLSILCVFILLVTFIFPVSAVNDGDEKTMTGRELSIKRIIGEIAKKTEVEIAKDILRELGMSENLINGVNKEYLDMIYNAKNISANEQYGEVNSEGEVTLLPNADFAEENSVKTQNNSEISTLSLKGETSDEETNSTFHKYLYVIETKNAPVGTMGMICAFEWLTAPFYRCLDVIVISSPQITFHEEETFLAVSYNEIVSNSSTLETISSESVLEEYDYTDMDNNEKILFSSNFVAAKHNLPNNLNNGWKRYWRQDIGIILMASGKVTNVQEGLEVELGVTGSYFHQTFWFEGDISLSGEGASISISPAIKYDDPHQIQVTPTFVP